MAIVINHEFRDSAKQANFPFTVDSTLQQGSVQIPNDCFIDALLYPVQSREAPFYIKRLNNKYADPGAMEIVIYGSRSKEVGKAVCYSSEEKSMVHDSAGRVVGVLVYSSEELTLLMGQIGNADLTLADTVARFTAGVSFSTTPEGPLYINTENNSYTEDVIIAAAGGVHFETTPSDPSYIESSSEHSVVSSSSQTLSTSSSSNSSSSSSSTEIRTTSSSSSSESSSKSSSSESESSSSSQSSDSSMSSVSGSTSSVSSISSSSTSSTSSSSTSSSTQQGSTTSSDSSTSSSSFSSSSSESSSSSTESKTWLRDWDTLLPYDDDLEAYYQFTRLFTIKDQSRHHRDWSPFYTVDPRPLNTVDLGYGIHSRFSTSYLVMAAADTQFTFSGEFTLSFLLGLGSAALQPYRTILYSYKSPTENFIIRVNMEPWGDPANYSYPEQLEVIINGASTTWELDESFRSMLTSLTPTHWVITRDASGNLSAYYENVEVDPGVPRVSTGTIDTTGEKLWLLCDDSTRLLTPKQHEVYFDELGIWSTSLPEAARTALYSNGDYNQYTAVHDDSSSSTYVKSSSSSEAPYSTVSSSSSTESSSSSTVAQTSSSTEGQSSSSLSSSSISSLSSSSSSSSPSSSSDSSSRSGSSSSSSESSSSPSISSTSSSSSSSSTESVSSISESTQAQTTSSSNSSNSSSSSGSSSSSELLRGGLDVSINIYGELSDGLQPIVSINGNTMNHAWLAAHPDAAIRVRTFADSLFIGRSKDFGDAS
jgi:hypothetical protein